MDPRYQATADALGIPLEDLLTAISYETAGTFDPRKKGPVTQWGQHEGLIQFGEPQREQFGVDLSTTEAALDSQLGADGAIVKYMLAHGFRPGEHGFMDLYSTINAGAPGRYNASDANNGGAPGTVYDKVTNQMEGHRKNAFGLMGGTYTPITRAGLDMPPRSAAGLLMGTPVDEAAGLEADARRDKWDRVSTLLGYGAEMMS